ncbi:MAG: hypothetical protein QM817_31340 [Archangium sp.]
MLRRLAWLGLWLGWSACPLPEDTFLVSGTAEPNVEVRLLRNKVASKSRCSALEPLDVTTADADGRFSFSVLRQEITGGENDRRFFSIESDAPNPSYHLVRRFWFPDADLELGPWRGSNDESFDELEVDGAIAWRGPQFSNVDYALNRDYRRRNITHAFEWKEVPIDSLGRVDYVPVETRRETDWTPVQVTVRDAPASRGGECPFIDVKPCPLTDGRFLPYTFAPGTRTLVFNFGEDFILHTMLFHGLVLERAAVNVKYEFNFVVDYDQWNPGGTARLDAVKLDRESEFCDEPGAFISQSPNLRALTLRVSFVDEAGALVPITALSEISAR